VGNAAPDEPKEVLRRLTDQKLVFGGLALVI